MRILIVEDEVTIARFLESILRDRYKDADIVVAYTLAEAKKALSTPPPTDLVTLDLSLPDSAVENTLLEVAAIKAVNPQAIVVIVSGVVKYSQIELSLNSADAFLEKHQAIAGDHLSKAIQKAFESRGWEHNLAAQEAIVKAMYP